MTSTCPQCGTHLSIVRSQDAGNIIVGTTPQQSDSIQPGNADQGSPSLSSSKHILESSREELGSNEDYRRHLKGLICLCFESWQSARHLSFRQYLCVGHIGYVQPGRPSEILDRTTTKMHAAIRGAGEVCGGTLLTSRRRDRPAGAEKVFQAIGAIVYDMEWTSDHGEPELEHAEILADAQHTISPNFNLDSHACPTILESMLLTDYGFLASPVFGHPIGDPLFGSELDALWSFERFSGFLTATAWRWKQGHAIPDQESWDLIVRVLEGGGTWSKGYLTWDAAIMLYYYHSRRRPVSAAARRQGWTGYTGVLQEMVAEIPVKGVDRLERKLSLDVHYLIPTMVKDQTKREQMIYIARDVANWCGCSLGLSGAAPITSRFGASNWREWFDSIFGFTSRRIRFDDEENRGEKEKVIGRLEK